MADVYGNRYEVIERVGDGGMASVYRGTDRLLKREVAIKVMHPHLAARADARARFSREAQATARLKHPNIVDVYDYSVSSDDQSYLITEFVRGETLTAFIHRHGTLLPQAAALVGHALAGALAHAHAAGLIHRDIKPDNLMISRRGDIKLMDFGIATAVDLEGMTVTGAIVGSPAHMAPEQIEGEALDARCDLFALGIVLYFVVTKRLPFQASNAHALFRQILEGQFDPPTLHNAAVDRQFESILLRCLARRRDDRHPTALALQESLAAYLGTFQLGETTMLLPRLLQAPETFQLEQRSAIVRTWTVEGQRFARAGQLALAIDAFQQALAIDADADEPRRGLTSLTTRNRRMRRLRRVGVAIALCAATACIVWLWARSSAAPSAAVGAAVATVGPPTPLPQPPSPAMARRMLAGANTAGTRPADGSAVAVAAAATATTTTAAATTGAAASGAVGGAAGDGSPRTALRSRSAVVRTGRTATKSTPLHEPQPPQPRIAVQLSCQPANVDLTFGGHVGSGVVRVSLTPGTYTFSCAFAGGRQQMAFVVRRDMELSGEVPKFKLIQSLPH